MTRETALNKLEGTVGRYILQQEQGKFVDIEEWKEIIQTVSKPEKGKIDYTYEEEAFLKIALNCGYNMIRFMNLVNNDICSPGFTRTDLIRLANKMGIDMES